MKKRFILAFIFLATLLIRSQSQITDISPDGRQTNNYKLDNINNSGQILVASQDVPYGNTPSWSAKRERQCAGLAFMDYDLDGDLDLAVGNYFSNSFPPITEYENFIFRNDNGVLDTFPRWISSDMRNTNDIAWGDVNGDGRPDLLSASGSFAKSVIYFNSAAGLSTSPGWISNDNNWTVGAAFADVDGDGYLEMAFANQGVSPDPYRPINIFNNNGGTLPTTPSWASSDLMITNSLAFADMDNADLVKTSIFHTANGNAYAFFVQMVPIYKIDSIKVNNVKVYNYLTENVSGWVSLGYKPANGSSVQIYYTYISKGDMAGAKWVNFSSGMYFNNNGVMNTAPGWNTGYTGGQKGIAWADIDLDGYLDLAIGGSSSPNVIYKNNSGTMGSTPYWQSSGTNTSVQDLKFCDVNKDGYPDLALVHFGYSRVDIFINRNGTLDASPTWSYSVGTSSTAIAFGDVNGDGWADLAIGTARKPVMVFLADPSLIPVELNAFTSSVERNDVKLNWSTSTEKNNKGFEIERSQMSKVKSEKWERIGFVAGKGTTTKTSEYFFEDKNLTDGKYSYRLKQIDFDGTFKYYDLNETIEVNIPGNFELFQNYPNPFNPTTIIRYSITCVEAQCVVPVQLKIFDILGNKVTTLVDEYKPTGNYEVEFKPASGIQYPAAGVYLYQLKAGNFIETKKMILLR